jgi:hypothetical protein
MDTKILEAQAVCHGGLFFNTSPSVLVCYFVRSGGLGFAQELSIYQDQSYRPSYQNQKPISEEIILQETAQTSNTMPAHDTINSGNGQLAAHHLFIAY